MTFRDTGTMHRADEAPASDPVEVVRKNEFTASSDPIRRYLSEATKTPLLTPEQERLLAQRMGRRRTMFFNAACAVPSLWPHAAALVRQVMKGERPATKVFMIGGVSEAEFHRHLEKVAGGVARLEEIAVTMTRTRCAFHDAVAQKKLWREGKAICASFKLRLPLLLRIVKQARRTIRSNARVTRTGRIIPCSDCAWRAAHAAKLHASFVETRNRLVCAHLRLVVFIAKQVARHPSQILELIQEGNFGLLYATEKYDAREKCQFHSYAYWWIRQSMTRAVANKSRLIRIPVNLQDAPSRIRDGIMKFRTTEGRDPTADELRDKLDLSRAEVERYFRASVRCFSLDQVAADQDESPLSSMLADPREPGADLDNGWVLHSLDKVLQTLAPREREILVLRFGLGHDKTYTLEDVAKIYNLSRERVRQIEIKAIEKLRHPKRARDLKALMDLLG